MKERETKEFITTGGTKIIHYTYITGREFNELEKLALKGTDVKYENGEIKVGGLNVLSEKEKEQKIVEIMTISVNGDAGGAYDAVLDLPYSEYLEIVQLYNSLTSKKKS